MVDQEGNEATLEYDLMWNVSKQTDANGNSTLFAYNKLNRLESITNAKGTQVRFEYDPKGNRTKVHGPQGEEIGLSYDTLDRITKIVEPDGATTSAEYDYMGQVTKVTDTMGYMTKFEYDMAGQKITETDPSGRELTYTYTALGQVATVTDTIGRTVRYDYLPGGLLERVTYPDGRYEKYSYDCNKNVVSKASHDGYTINYEYDCLNRITTISSSTDQVKTHTYDAVGNVTGVTDANGNTTKYMYSPNGKLISVIDPLGNKSEYDYDKVGNLTEVRQLTELYEANEINDQNSRLRVTKYEWDELGLVEKITDALGNIEKYTYDESGNVTSKFDKDGFLTKYAYTTTNQLEEVVYADGKSVKLSYNPLRQLTEIKDWLGITSIDVDELGRATKVTDHNGREVEYTFGTEGERRSITYPDGKVAEYIYDDSLRLKTLIDGENKIDYLYDTNNRLSDKIFSSGVSTKYTYNDIGLLSELAHSDRDGILDKYTYSYDKMVNKVGIEKYRRNLEDESGKYSYSYDALSRLTEVHKDGAQIRSFGYDEFGNRSQMTDNSVTTNYTYNALNQLTSTNDTKGITQHFNYDKRGNLTQILENNNIKNTYEFGAINRLTKATNAMGHIASYDYNGFGFRVGKQVTDNLSPTKHISYVLDLTKQYHNLLQVQDNTQTQSYTWDNNVAFADGNAYLQDELGSPLRYIDNTGCTIDSCGYTEFGDDLYGNQGRAQPFGYTGYTADNIAGTYFAQAREYMPHVGRFAGEDIIKGNTIAPMTMNQYTYCWNSPLTLVDLDGMIPTIFPDIDGDDVRRWFARTVYDVYNTVNDVNNAIEFVAATVVAGTTAVANEVTDFWNTHIYGYRTVTNTEWGSRDGIAGGYVVGRTSVTVPCDVRTGNIIVRTTTITHPSGVRAPIRVDNGISINTNILNIGGSFGDSGLRANASTGLDILGYGIRSGVNVGIGGRDIVSVGGDTRVGWNNNWYGIGAFVPANFSDSARVFAFRERINGNISEYTEWGAHMRMGGLYAAVASVIFAILVVKSFGTGALAKPAYLALMAILLGTAIVDADTCDIS